MILKNKKGDAMIAVAAIMAILVTLCLSMLLAASVLVYHAQEAGLTEQCRLSAVSFAKELDKDLTNVATPDRPLTSYIKNNIAIDGGSGSWPYYKPEEAGHGEEDGVYKILKAEGPQGMAGNISIKMYWLSESGGSSSGITLNVEVTAEKNDRQYTIRSEYMPTAGNPPLAWKLEKRY